MNKVELFLKGLQSEHCKSNGLIVEKSWTGNVMFSFPTSPKIKFRAEPNRELNPDGSLDIMWMDFDGPNQGVHTFTKSFIDSIISTINK